LSQVLIYLTVVMCAALISTPPRIARSFFLTANLRSISVCRSPDSAVIALDDLLPVCDSIDERAAEAVEKQPAKPGTTPGIYTNNGRRNGQ
jgi:hypothetical protein